jgi:hypothetical protein
MRIIRSVLKDPLTTSLLMCLGLWSVFDLTWAQTSGCFTLIVSTWLTVGNLIVAFND